MLKLGVNIDHTATLREARYRGQSKGEPDPIEAALLCVEAGCHGITAHLREDRRHIQDRDIDRLASMLTVPLNFEIANTPEMITKALEIMPAAVCMVPEKREEVTTEGGLDVSGQMDAISKSVSQLQDAGIEVSLFIDPDEEVIRASHATGAKAIELHTGAYAEAFSNESTRGAELERLTAASNLAHSLGLKVNAGHGLNYSNLSLLLQVPWLEELNIGHSIVARALTVGFEKAVREILDLM
ncbi:MAG: pyridoxine 5'-phosphate synthase [Verrucomicrobia bacterium]|nr:pyridoxine 5'-phosphate synthase [Verrucomicrobiota bacterium]